MKGAHHLTRECEEVVRRCNETFTIDQGTGVVSYLRELTPKVMDLSSRFGPQTHRMSAYRVIASEVVAAALERPPVCFATYGHPKMYSYPTMLIQQAAAILDLRLTVLPGISFLDTLITDIGADPGLDGLQLYEATDLLMRLRPLQTDVALVIVQAPVVGDPRLTPTSENLSNLKLLQDYLLKFYPAEHQISFVVSSTHPLLKPVVQRFPLGSLAKALSQGSQSGTLYVPPVGRRAIADQKLAERLLSGK